MVKEIVAAVVWLISVQSVLAADVNNAALVEPEVFSQMVAQKKYKEAHDTAVAEAKLVPVYSGAKWPTIPIENGQPFRTKMAIDSGRKWPEFEPRQLPRPRMLGICG